MVAVKTAVKPPKARHLTHDDNRPLTATERRFRASGGGRPPSSRFCLSVSDRTHLRLPEIADFNALGGVSGRELTWNPVDGTWKALPAGAAISADTQIPDVLCDIGAAARRIQFGHLSRCKAQPMNPLAGIPLPLGDGNLGFGIFRD